jgi:hypothetical protein
MNQELQLGKYEFFPYDENIHRLLDELLMTDEEREKHGEDFLDKLLERRKRARPQNARQRKRR